MSNNPRKGRAGPAIPRARICLPCGISGVELEGHEPAGWWVERGIRVRVCPPCHAEASERQRIAGFKLRRDHPRTWIDHAYQVLRGACDLVAMSAKQRDAGPEPEEFERLGKAIVMVIDRFTDAGLDTEFGPDPLGNDARTSVRRRRREADPLAPRAAVICDATATAAFCEAIFGLLGRSALAIFGSDDTLDLDAARAGLHIAETSPQIAGWLVEAEGSDAWGRFCELLARGEQVMHEFLEALLAAETETELLFVFLLGGFIVYRLGEILIGCAVKLGRVETLEEALAVFDKAGELAASSRPWAECFPLLFALTLAAAAAKTTTMLRAPNDGSSAERSLMR